MRFKLPANERLQYLAGQYVDFLLKDGQRRSFSLATAPHDDALLELHIRHIPGGFFTDPLFTKYKGREILRIEGPLGSFYLREESDKPMIFVAGGTGFAPIKAMIEHAFHHEVDRPMVLYWGARSLADLYLPELPGHWQQQHPNFTFIPVLSEPKPEDTWPGRTGLRPPGGARRLQGPVRLPGVRVRRAADDRRRAQDFTRDARLAGRRVLRRQLHVRGGGGSTTLGELQSRVVETPRVRRALGARQFPSASFSAAARCAFAASCRPSRASISPSATCVRQPSSSARLAS